MKIIYVLFRFWQAFFLRIKHFARWCALVWNNPRCFISYGALIEYTSIRNIRLGIGCSIGRFSAIYAISDDSLPGGGYISIGDNTYIGEFQNLRTGGGIIEIGKNCLISQRVTIVATNHSTSPDKPVNAQPSDFSKHKVVIGDGCWLGAGAIILPGVSLGEGCIVAAGAVVTHSFQANSIIAGSPAKLLRSR